MKIEQALGERDVDGPMQAVISYFLQRATPNVFDPYDDACVIFQFDREFEDLCISMEENGVAAPKLLTTFEYYSRIQYFEKRAQKLK